LVFVDLYQTLCGKGDVGDEKYFKGLVFSLGFKFWVLSFGV